jgi:predicted nucleic-acid-binding protein
MSFKLNVNELDFYFINVYHDPKVNILRTVKHLKNNKTLIFLSEVKNIKEFIKKTINKNYFTSKNEVNSILNDMINNFDFYFKKDDFLYKLGNIIINYKNEFERLSIIIEKLSKSLNNSYEIFFLFYHLENIVNLEKDSTFTLIDFILDNVK